MKHHQILSICPYMDWNPHIKGLPLVHLDLQLSGSILGPKHKPPSPSSEAKPLLPPYSPLWQWAVPFQSLPFLFIYACLCHWLPNLYSFTLSISKKTGTAQFQLNINICRNTSQNLAQIQIKFETEHSKVRWPTLYIATKIVALATKNCNMRPYFHMLSPFATKEISK